MGVRKAQAQEVGKSRYSEMRRPKMDTIAVARHVYMLCDAQNYPNSSAPSLTQIQIKIAPGCRYAKTDHMFGTCPSHVREGIMVGVRYAHRL